MVHAVSLEQGHFLKTKNTLQVMLFSNVVHTTDTILGHYNQSYLQGSLGAAYMRKRVVWGRCGGPNPLILSLYL